MIPRYTPEPMARLWNDDAKWRRVLDVELTTAEILAADGVIPADAAAYMREHASFDVAQIAENEKTVRHDVIAFLQSVGDSLGEHKRWLHVGLTSYDVVDTALSMALRDAGELIRAQLLTLRDTMEAQAEAHKLTLMPGRTHGVHAEHTTLGWKICGWIAELDRDIQRWHYALQRIAVGKISGAVGTFPTINPDQERRICENLGLEPDPISTQVISRDRHAEYMNVLALIAGLVERIALEIRLLQHSEVEELLEPFGSGQRGSSAMPHKKNPVVTENLCGLARLVRSNAMAEFENMALWHERDISHSSVERVILPDSTSLVYFMLDKINWVVGNWNVNVDKMRAHVEQDRGLMNSGLVLTANSLALTTTIFTSGYKRTPWLPVSPLPP
ncbi:adenylosuccinate lyase [Calditrichota bacterium]